MGVGGSEQGPASRAASSGHPEEWQEQGSSGALSAVRPSGPRRSHEQWFLEGGQGQGPGEGEAGPGPTVHLPLLSFSPKAFANLPLNILPSRDHSKCHFGSEISYIVSPGQSLSSTARAGGASRKPAGLESCRPGGQLFCVCHCLTCRKSPSPYPEQCPIPEGWGPTYVCTCPRRPPQTSQWNVRSPSRSETAPLQEATPGLQEEGQGPPLLGVLAWSPGANRLFISVAINVWLRTVTHQEMLLRYLIRT